MRALRALGLAWAAAIAGAVGAAAVVKRAVPSRGDAGSDELALVAVLDGVELASRAQGFRGGSLLAWFGGIDLDLRAAALAPGARLSVHALFGGVSIRVPPGCRVESKVHAVFGGVDVARPDGEGGPALAVDGLAVFGGVSVR